MMLAQNPANRATLCAEKSMPVCLMVSPNLKPGPCEGPRASDAVGRVSAASLIAPSNQDVATSLLAAADPTPSLAGFEPSIHWSYQRLTFSRFQRKNA